MQPGRKKGFTPYNKINWTLKMISFLKDNYESQSNAQLADSLGLKITTLRTKLYELGYKRMDLEYWTAEQVTFLKNNYKKIGDLELSEIFNAKWKKQKGWTKKTHGEKAPVPEAEENEKTDQSYSSAKCGCWPLPIMSG